MGDGCPVCGTAMRCTCEGTGLPRHGKRIDHEEHYSNGDVCTVYDDGSREWCYAAEKGGK